MTSTPPRVTSALVEIDRDVGERELIPERGRDRDGRHVLGDPAQHGLDPREQLGEGERLGDVVVGAEPERGDLVELAVARRQHDHRHEVVGRAQRGQHLEAVASSGRLMSSRTSAKSSLLGLVQRLVAIARDRGLATGELEVEREPGRDRVVVLDDQDPAAHDGTGFPGCAPSSPRPAICGSGSRRRRSRIRNVVSPGRDTKSILPLWPRTIARTNASPRPTPGSPLVDRGACRD